MHVDMHISVLIESVSTIGKYHGIGSNSAENKKKCCNKETGSQLLFDSHGTISSGIQNIHVYENIQGILSEVCNRSV